MNCAGLGGPDGSLRVPVDGELFVEPLAPAAAAPAAVADCGSPIVIGDGLFHWGDPINDVDDTCLVASVPSSVLTVGSAWNAGILGGVLLAGRAGTTTTVPLLVVIVSGGMVNVGNNGMVRIGNAGDPDELIGIPATPLALICDCGDDDILACCPDDIDAIAPWGEVASLVITDMEVPLTADG